MQLNEETFDQDPRLCNNGVVVSYDFNDRFATCFVIENA